VYILGFGFDEDNCRRIGLDKLRDTPKSVMFTNFGNINTINKKVSKLFLGNHNYFLHETSAGVPGARYFETSIRNVYDALAMDFDALEGLGRVDGFIQVEGRGIPKSLFL
jgi:hypothetical protein